MASDFREGLACVTLDNKTGAIDKSGKIVIDYKYEWLNEFNGNRAFYINIDFGELLIAKVK